MGISATEGATRLRKKSISKIFTQLSFKTPAAMQVKESIIFTYYKNNCLPNEY
jgi:hypothetical protein